MSRALTFCQSYLLTRSDVNLYQLFSKPSLVIENRPYLACVEQLHRIERESKLKVKLLLVIITEFMLEGKQMRPIYPCVYALLINAGFQS